MPPTGQTIQGYLQGHALFSQLKEEAVLNFASYALLKAEKRGTVIFSPESSSDKFYLIVSGWVKLFRETMGGAEAVTDVLTAGGVFGEIALTGRELVPYGAEVIEDAEIISIPRFLLSEEIVRNGLFGLHALRHLAWQKNRSDMEVEHRTVQSAPQRIGCFLLKLCPDRQSAEAVAIQLPYDKMDIARRLGMQPETFSRALVRLREDAGVRVKGTCVEIDNVGQLMRYTCAACSSGAPCGGGDFR